MTTGSTFLAAILVSICGVAVAATNIDPTASGNQYGWSENGGWFNMEGDGANGVVVAPDYLSGFGWLENFGWVNFGDGSPEVGSQYSNASATDFGVNNDRLGNLTGYAWAENIGWLVFDTTGSGGSQVTISPATGSFSGYAWSENVGWISFADVAPSSVAQVPVSAVPVAISGFSLE